MQRGEIFRAHKKYWTPELALHPIIFWDDHDSDTFIGMMLTHGENTRFPDNKQLNDPKYYSETYDDFSETYVVAQVLVKKNEWRTDFEKKIGMLSAEGIAFVEDNIINMTKPQFWPEYLRRSIRKR